MVYQANEMDLKDKLKILSDAAKYDVACTSSGAKRTGKSGSLGNSVESGICHSFSADGRCISLLKILLTNHCIYDCKYCINRKTNDVARTAFTPEEICSLTMEFYKRNYIEGLFLSSGIISSPDITMELIYQVLFKLRNSHGFRGYIHVKGIPGASEELIEKVGYLADRMSINLELPTAEGLRQFAPGKTREKILIPMKQIQKQIQVERHNFLEAKNGIIYKNGRDDYSLRKNGNYQTNFVPAGQSTQIIIGATPENDYQMIRVAEALYKNYDLKRVFYSAYIPINEVSTLPSLEQKPPLLREHRLYQADWLLRFYGFQAEELLQENNPNFNVYLDPKCDWAIRNLDEFPIEINRAPYEKLLRVPGLGVRSAKRIIAARRSTILEFEDLKKLGVVLKRAVFFITCNGRMDHQFNFSQDYITNQIIGVERRKVLQIEEANSYHQLNLFDDFNVSVPIDEAELLQTKIGII